MLGVLLIAATTTWKAASWATTNTAGASECTTLTGTAKTASLVNLSVTTPQSAGVVFALNATGCTVPRVDAQATNGPATQAALVGTLKSPSARCVLSTSDERPWGKLTVKWKNAAGAPLLNGAGNAIKDQLFVRLDPDGSERYDLHGFDTNGPDGGGDVSAEIGLQRLAGCGSGPTKWSVISDGTIVQGSPPGSKDPGVSEVIGGDGDTDSFVIERFSSAAAVPISTTTSTTTMTTTTSTTVATGAFAANNGTGTTAEVDYCRLQTPIVVTLNEAGSTTPPIYGRISEFGVTNLPGPAATVIAQLGYGPAGSDPRTASGWTWTTATYNPLFAGAGPADEEYFGTIAAPQASGDYRYAFRFSVDGGATATYCDKDGAGSGGGTFDPLQLGDLIVQLVG
jgi:hypothetical protein